MAMSLFSPSLYLHVQPHITIGKRIVETLNEVVILILSYNLILFTWFVPETETQYQIGNLMVWFYIGIFVVNMTYMSINTANNFKSNQRKK